MTRLDPRQAGAATARESDTANDKVNCWMLQNRELQN